MKKLHGSLSLLLLSGCRAQRMKIKKWAIIAMTAAITVFAASFFIISAMTHSSTEENAFFDTDWRLFYGTKDSKEWISHPAVDKVAKKLLLLKHVSYAETARKEMFPFSIRFVSSDRRECILFFNTEHGSFDKKRVFVHRLTGEDMENFYLAVGRQ